MKAFVPEWCEKCLKGSNNKKLKCNTMPDAMGRRVQITTIAPRFRNQNINNETIMMEHHRAATNRQTRRIRAYLFLQIGTSRCTTIELKRQIYSSPLFQTFERSWQQSDNYYHTDYVIFNKNILNVFPLTFQWTIVCEATFTCILADWGCNMHVTHFASYKINWFRSFFFELWRILI